ncbi:MAG TPA: hypothetical protein VJP41_10120, partial [Gaiellaceae bacterium]|nr:hypothetical protein [Gaiellaceae bacterium]
MTVTIGVVTVAVVAVEVATVTVATGVVAVTAIVGAAGIESAGSETVGTETVGKPSVEDDGGAWAAVVDAGTAEGGAAAETCEAARAGVLARDPPAVSARR